MTVAVVAMTPAAVQGTHTRLYQDGVEGGQQDDGQVRGAGDDQRKQIPEQEYHRHQNISGFDVPDGPGQYADRDSLAPIWLI